MGIPGLNTWFKKTFRNAYVDLRNVKVDHLYVDMNSVLHLVLRRAKNKHQFYVLLFRKCDFILTACRPRKSVMFALDGPAPLAKLLTQRVRRKRIALTPSDLKGKTVSPLALTPGTHFMQEIHESLAYFICQRLIGSKWSHLRMELSGSTVQGEGETKILSRLQQPMDHVKPTDTHALIGNDSDLLMMSLLAGNSRVFVLGQILDSPDDLPTSLGNLKVFSADSLRKPLEDLVPALKNRTDQSRSHFQAIKRDLAVTCILSRGNDYLPSVGGVALEGVEDSYSARKRDTGLWSSYLQLRNGKDFQLRSLSVWKNGEVALDYEFFHHLFQEAGIKRTSRKVLETHKEPEPHLYLDGIRWIIQMYSNGMCPDYRYVYEGVGPTSQELCEAILERLQSSRFEETGKDLARLPLRPSECALAMLPYQARQYVPEPLRHLMEPDSPIGDLFQDCNECVKFSEESSALQKQQLALTGQIVELKERIGRFKDGEARTAKLQSRLEQIEQKSEAIRQNIRDNSKNREAHVIEKHPYAPFPVGRVEEAVRNVPQTKFSAKDHELFAFGKDLVFERTRHAAKICKSSTTLFPIRQNAPEPPSEKFKRFKVPLPIARGTYPYDRMTAKAFAMNSRRLLSMMKRLPL